MNHRHLLAALLAVSIWWSVNRLWAGAYPADCSDAELYAFWNASLTSCLRVCLTNCEPGCQVCPFAETHQGPCVQHCPANCYAQCVSETRFTCPEKLETAVTDVCAAACGYV